MLLAVLAGVGGLAFLALRPPQESIETITLSPHSASTASPAMCPWRDPEGDLRTFFPGATDYRTEILVLSRLRSQILQRLGSGARIESNALYVHRVPEKGAARGSILVRRTAGPHGAIEVVVAVGAEGRVVGVRVQRHREPAAAARLFAPSGWLGAFRGKSADSTLRPGEDLPAVSPEARPAAEAVAQAVRALLVEYTLGEEEARNARSTAR